MWPHWMRTHHVEFWDQDTGGGMTTGGRKETEHQMPGQEKGLDLPMPQR